MLGCISILLLSATLVDARQVASGDFIGQRVSIRGVVSAAVRDDIDDGFNWVLLKTPEGTVCASTDNRVHSLEELLPLLDADVEAHAFNGLQVPEGEGVVVAVGEEDGALRVTVA